MNPTTAATSAMHGLPRLTPSLQLRHFVQDDALEAMALNAEPSTRLWLPSHVYATVDEAQSRMKYLISYAIAESARGRGYGVESLTCACDWVASTFSVSRVLAITAVENIPSRRILERASFAHVQDEDMRFQGVRKAVSRYCWHTPTQRSGAKVVAQPDTDADPVWNAL